MTEQRRQAAEGDTMLAEGGMTVAIANMRAHYLGGKKQLMPRWMVLRC